MRDTDQGSRGAGRGDHATRGAEQDVQPPHVGVRRGRVLRDQAEGGEAGEDKSGGERQLEAGAADHPADGAGDDDVAEEEPEDPPAHLEGAKPLNLLVIEHQQDADAGDAEQRYRRDQHHRAEGGGPEQAHVEHRRGHAALHEDEADQGGEGDDPGGDDAGAGVAVVPAFDEGVDETGDAEDAEGLAADVETAAGLTGLGREPRHAKGDQAEHDNRQEHGVPAEVVKQRSRDERADGKADA